MKFNTDKLQESGDFIDGSSRYFDEVYLEQLNNLVYDTSELYVQIIDDRKTEELVEHLFCLIQDFDSEKFFVHLIGRMEVGDNCKNLFFIYENLLLKWLRCEDLRSKPVVDMIFLLMKYLKPEDKLVVLDKFAEVIINVA